MAMIYAIEEINKNPELLPNITLGYQIYDSCTSARKALEGTLALLSNQAEPVPNYSCGRKDTLVGFIGDLSSSTSYSMAQLTGIYKYTQISYGALDPVFSNKIRFPSFYRTVPNELSQYAGIAQLLKYFGWSWVGILASDDDSGERAVRELKREITLVGACIEFTYMIPTQLLTEARQKIQRISEKIKTCTANVIIVYSSGTSMTQYFMHGGWRYLPSKIWIASVTMSFVTESIYGETLRTLNGTLAFSLRKGEISGFKEFLYDVSPMMFPEYEALDELWQITFNCKLKDKNSFSNKYIAQLPFCSRNETLRNLDLSTYDVYNFRFSYGVYRAVYALAHALNCMILSTTPLETDNSAEILKQYLRPWKLNRCLQKIHLMTSDGEEFAFDQAGDAPPQFDILNWVYFPNGTIMSNPVGRFNPSAPPDRQLLINPNAILWPSEGPSLKTIPPSVCSKSCPPGFHKVQIEGKPNCCFYCVPCAEGQFSNSTDVDTCLSCPEDQWPNDRKDDCIQKYIVFLSYGDTIGFSLACISIVFAITTAGVLLIFLRHKDTPIVKANNRDLSYALLISLILAFLCSLLFIGRPETWTCFIQQAAFGVIFTVAVSCVLAKTITVVIAFNSTKPGSRVNKWLGSKVSGSMVLLCTLGEVCIGLSWLLTAPPHPYTDLKSETGKMVLECDPGSVTTFYAVIGYIGLLALASFVVAFLARNLPDRFNEAQLITFSMLVFCSVWVSFIPAYLSTKGRYMVAVEVFAILASSAGLLGFIFVPKCFIILLRPDMNTRKLLVLRSNL